MGEKLTSKKFGFTAVFIFFSKGQKTLLQNQYNEFYTFFFFFTMK